MFESRFLFTTRRLFIQAVAGAFAALLAAPALADVKLITLPVRERVMLQLDHPWATLVEEERIVPLNQGGNDLVFAWTNTSVDAATIQLRILTRPEAIKVVAVSYPPGVNQLTWNVFAPEAGSARVRISYLINNLNKGYEYKAVAAADETTIDLSQYLLVHNQANEAFGEAGMSTGMMEPIDRPIGINETHKLLAARFESVAIRKVFRADVSLYGYEDPAKKQLRIALQYEFKNGEQSGMGRYSLMPGKARVFQVDPAGSTAFLGEDMIAFVPREDEAAIYLGDTRDVVIKRTFEKQESERVLGNLYNYDIIIKYEMENFKDKPVVVDLSESPVFIRNEVVGQNQRPVEWELLNDSTIKEMKVEDKSSAETLLFRVPLPAAGGDQKAQKATHVLHLKIKNEWR